jgi:hypothetical protein
VGDEGRYRDDGKKGWRGGSKGEDERTNLLGKELSGNRVKSKRNPKPYQKKRKKAP